VGKDADRDARADARTNGDVAESLDVAKAAFRAALDAHR
jgi:hypothetical protein